jgi:hypothetical protein
VHHVTYITSIQENCMRLAFLTDMYYVSCIRRVYVRLVWIMQFFSNRICILLCSVKMLHDCVLHMLETAQSLYFIAREFMSNGVCLPYCPFKRGSMTVLCSILFVSSYLQPPCIGSMYYSLEVCGVHIIIEGVILFTCFCLHSFTF